MGDNMLQRVTEESVETKLRTAALPSLSGHWVGQYDYLLPEPGVPFVATLSHDRETFTGTSSEPNTFSRYGGSRLEADLSGTLTADGIEFSKAYRGVPDARHIIHYSGSLSAERDHIQGSWRVSIPGEPDFTGVFWMKRQRAANEAEPG